MSNRQKKIRKRKAQKREKSDLQRLKSFEKKNIIKLYPDLKV